MNALSKLKSRYKDLDGVAAPALLPVQEGLACRLKLSQRMTIRFPVHMSKLIANMARTEQTSPSDLVRALVGEAVRARAERAAAGRGARQ